MKWKGREEEQWIVYMYIVKWKGSEGEQWTIDRGSEVNREINNEL